MHLELTDVSSAPPGVADPIVRGLSFALAAGEWLAVGGANGCGKSTFLLTVAGLLPPRSGSREVTGGPEAAAPRIATILQDPSVQLFAPTVAEEIGLTALHLGFSAGRIDRAVQEWSARLGLEGELHRTPRDLSAGRQQLVLLAAALASNPELLVADEAGAHLDSAARGRVLAMLDAERSRGLAILWATQDHVERNAADRALELRRSEAGDSVLVPWQEEEPPDLEDRPSLPATGPPVLRLRVRPAASEEGPRVRTEQGFTLEVAARGITTLTGANGAGKSVLLQVACGLLDLPQIEIERGPGGAPPLLVGQYPERQIFEESVDREVAFAARARGVSDEEVRRRIEEVLERLGISKLGNRQRRTWELSAGERRLILLAGALIAPAGLLALDEPTAGLDPERRQRLAVLLSEIGKDRPVLVASQDSDWIDRLGGRTCVIGASGPDSSPSKKTD